MRRAVSVQRLFVSFWMLVCVGVVFAYSNTSFLRGADDFKELVLYGACFFIGFVFFLRSLLSKKNTLKIDQLSFFVFVYLAYVFLRAFLTHTPRDEGILIFGKCFLLVVSIYIVSQFETKQVILLFKSLIYFGLLGLVASYLVSYSNSVFVFYPFGHVSYVADFLLLLLPWTIYLFFLKTNKVWRVFYALLTLYFITEIFLFSRRATLLALFFTLIIGMIVSYVFAKKDDKLRLIKVLSLILLVSVIIGGVTQFYSLKRITKQPTAISRVAKTIDFDDKSFNTSGRELLFTNAFLTILEKPLLGWGYGNFRYTYKKQYFQNLQSGRRMSHPSSNWHSHVHNEPIMQLYEGGLVGLILFFVPVFLIFYLLIKKIRTSNESDGVLLSFVLLLGLLAIFVSTLFTTSTTNPQIRLLLVLYLAMSYKFTKPYLKFKILQFKKLRVVIMSCCFVIFVFFSLFTLGQPVSSYLIKKANNDKLENKINHNLLTWALRLNPGTFNNLYFSALYEFNCANFKMAEHLLEKALQTYPNMPRVYEKLYEVYDSQGKIEKAHSIIKKAHNIFPYHMGTKKRYEQESP